MSTPTSDDRALRKNRRMRILFAALLWLTRYDHVHPRLLVTFAQLGAVDAPPLRAPFVINQLSWSPDGRTLAVSTFRRLPGATQPE